MNYNLNKKLSIEISGERKSIVMMPEINNYIEQTPRYQRCQIALFVALLILSLAFSVR